MRRSLVTLLGVIAAAASAACAAEPTSQPARMQTPAFVIVFDFLCKDKPEYGERLAETIRLKLRRHGDYDVIDQWTTKDFSQPLAADSDEGKIKELMTGLLAANVGVCGTVRAAGNAVQAEVRCLDLTAPDEPKTWTKAFADSTQRWHAVIATAIVESITGRPEWKPPEYGDEPTPKNFGKPVNVNGEFESGHEGWEHPDNVSTMLVEDEAGRGRVLKVRTDLARGPWLEYTRNLRFGLADPNRPPNIPTDRSEGAVGGMEGVHYRSDWIDAKPGQRYWLAADVKGLGGAKIFIKGYLDWTKQADGLPEASLVQRGLTPLSFAKLPPEQRAKIVAEDAKAHPERYRREVYRWYLNCGGGGGRWRHLAAPVPPRGALPDNVRWIQIQVYAYWPPGAYYFDNVHLYRDPTQKTPLPEEPARTPSFEKIRERYKNK